MSQERLYYTQLNQAMIQGAKYAILPGDPHRAKELALMLDESAEFVTLNRQHASYLVTIEGEKVLIISTGMGCPAITTTALELHQLGVENFVRLGTSGTIREEIELGDICFTRAAVKLDGISADYVEMGYPAVASISLTNSFMQGAKNEGVTHHLGITASSDTFWPGQERYDNYSGYLLRELTGAMREWQALNVANFEMEASALLTVASLLGVKAACFCGIIAKRTASEVPSELGKKRAKENWEKTLKAGLAIDIKMRRHGQ